MKLFYVAIYMVVCSLPVAFLSIYMAWDRTPPNLRLVQLDQILRTGSLTYIGLIVGSLLVFLVWLMLPGDRVRNVYQ
jgi:hypothetical protein